MAQLLVRDQVRETAIVTQAGELGQLYASNNQKDQLIQQLTEANKVRIGKTAQLLARLTTLESQQGRSQGLAQSVFIVVS